MANLVVITGRLTANPEIKTTQSGKNCCQFSIAVPRPYSGKDKERKTDFFDVTAWNERGEFVANYFTKGKWIEVIGALRSRTYEKDGVKRKVVDIVADKLSFVGDKEKAENTNTSQTNNFEEVEEDEDLPF